MKIGLTGDTHNNLSSIDSICKIFNAYKVALVIHTGDISLPKALDSFKKLNSKLIGVYGNNDQGDIKDLEAVCRKNNFDFVQGFREELIQGKKVFIVHDPLDIEDSFYAYGDMIFHGHTHRYRDEVFKNTHIFNPGECAGMLKGKNQVGIVDILASKMQIFRF